MSPTEGLVASDRLHGGAVVSADSVAQGDRTKAGECQRVTAESVLQMGIILGDGDRESMAWTGRIGALRSELSSLLETIESPVKVQIEFHVDGRMVPNEFVGVRAGRYFKKTSVMVVQAAVPKDVEEGAARSLLVGLLDASLIEANRAAVSRRLDRLPDELIGVTRRLST